MGDGADIEPEIRDAVRDYDDALVVGDVRRATTWFAIAVGADGAFSDTDSPVSRFGPSGEQFGASGIADARSSQPVVDAPVWIHDAVVPLAADTALHLGVMRRGGRDVQRTQVWRRRPEGWRIVHAHVSSRNEATT